MLTEQQKIRIQTRALTVRDAEIWALRSLFGLLKSEEFCAAVSRLLDCQGKVIVSGMGKVGHVGVRFAATLSSTGTPAIFLHPGEAAHGDLGVVSEGDLFIALSNSGKTREIRETVERLRHFPFSVPLVTMTGHPDSPLASFADVTLCYGEVQEPCPLGLVPSASIAAMSALCDALALALMELKGFSKEAYARNHHGGYNGQKARGEVA